MAEIDIAPELYNRIQNNFQKKYEKAQLLGNPLHKVFEDIKNGRATFQTADLYAGEVSNMLTDSINEVLTFEELSATKGKLYYNMAEKIIGRSLEEGYLMVSNVTNNVIEQINESWGIGIKPVAPKQNTWKRRQILDSAVKTETTTELHNVIRNSGGQYVRDAATETKKANAEFNEKAGLSVTVTRKYDHVGVHDRADDCQWCLKRVGTDVPYADAVAMGMFERHDGCGCIITYKTKKYTVKSNSKWGGFN